MPFWSRKFWRSYWIALVRSPKDKRARSIALRITVFSLYFLAAMLLFAGQLIYLGTRRGLWQAGFFAAIFAAGMIGGLLMRRSRDKPAITELDLAGLPQPEPHAVAPVIRHYLQERASILGSLISRAASEVYLQNHQLAPGTHAITRQAQNSLLRGFGLWEKLEPGEAGLMAAADGLWSIEQQNSVVVWCEQLRLLRWLLGIDSELTPLAHFPQIDFSLSENLPSPEQTGGEFRPVEDVRMERDVAMAYTARVIAEFKGRGMIGSEAGIDDWAGKLREESLGASTDYLAGSQTVGDLGEMALKMLGVVSAARERFASYLLELMDQAAPSSFTSWSDGPSGSD